MEIPCYDPADLLPVLHANRQYTIAIGMIDGRKSFVMANDKGEFGVYVIVGGAMCLVTGGKELQLMPLPPNA